MCPTEAIPDSIATPDREWSLLRAACSSDTGPETNERIHRLLSQSICWKFLYDLAERHGTQPLLCQALSGLGEAVPREQMQLLEQRAQINLHKAMFLSCELIRIFDCLAAVGIEVIPYKGLALAEAIYGDIALRQSGDIDLLIRPHDLPRIREVVKDLGYIPHSPLSTDQESCYLKSGYECAFDGAAGRNLLEVQWAIQPRFYAVDFDVEGLFQRAVTLSVAGHAMKTPSAEDSFLILSLHAAKHVWGRLIWLCDLDRIMKLPELNWDRIATQAIRLGIVRILRVTMLLATGLLGASIPLSAESSLPKDLAAGKLAEEIGRHITAEAAYDVESVDYFRLMLRLRERLSDRIRFVSRLALTPGPKEWAAVRLPGPLFPLYRLVRLTRLAARLVGTGSQPSSTAI
jgi:hypothetical protein